MAVPILLLSNVTYDSTRKFDATALTGGVGGLLTLQGALGSDFYIQRNGGPNAQRQKREGNLVMTPTPFADSGAAPTYSITTDRSVTWVGDDELGGQAPTQYGADSFGYIQDTWSVNFAASQVNCGLKWSIPCDQHLRTMNFVGRSSDGQFVVKASMSDGSMADRTLNLPINTNGWWKLQARSKDPCVLSVEIRKTTTSGGSGYLIPQLTWLEVPVAAPSPRGWKNAMRLLGISGGQNA